MDWFSNNWIWVVAIVGFAGFFLMHRSHGGMGAGCCGGGPRKLQDEAGGTSSDSGSYPRSQSSNRRTEAPQDQASK